MRVLKWLGGLLLLALLWMGLVATEWLPRPTAEDLALQETLARAPANTGGQRNAFALLQVFGHEVPESEWQAVAAADVAAFAQAQPGSAFKSTAEGRYPAHAEVPGKEPSLCSVWDPECLSKVRDHQSEARQWVSKLQARLVQGEALLGHDYYRYEFTPRADSPLAPMGGYFPILMSAIALKHLEGDSEEAFAMLCRHTAGWRQLRSHSDLLIMDMLGIALMTGATRLYAEMLAEMPTEFAAPCPEVFAPLADAELDQCPVYLFELRAMNNTIDALGDRHLSLYGESVSPILRAGNSLMNKRHAKALYARNLGRYCTDAQYDRIRARTGEPLPEPAACSAFEWALDPVGCQVSQASLDVEPYFKRLLDLDVRLKLLNTLLLVRGLPADAAQTAFDGRPAALRSAEHPMSIDTDAGIVRMIPLEKTRGNPWDLPVVIAP
jgi:hypothetical protein